MYRETLAKLLRCNPSLKKYRRKKLIAFYFKLVLIELAAVAATLYLYAYELPIAPVLGLIIAVGGPFLFLAPHKFFATRKMGVIKEINYVQRRMTEGVTGKMTYTDMKTLNFIECVLENPRGHRSHFEVKQQYQKIYHVGDEVIALLGVAYPVNLTPHSFALCPICGNIMPIENDDCVECGAAQIKVTESEQE